MTYSYARDTSSKIKAVKQSAYKTGKYIGCYAPYGYIKNPKDKHHLIIDEPAAAVVRKIFDLRCKGLGCRKIAQILNEEKILPPRAYYYQMIGKVNPYRCNGVWNDVTVRKLMRNEVYIGNMVQNKRGTLSYKNHKQNPNGKGWAEGAGYGEKILSILKGIPGTAGGTSKPAEAWYRVRKSWADASTQKGAFKSLNNAKKCTDENPGYSVFDETGVNIYTPKTASFSPYLVRVSIPDLNIRKGPGTNYGKTGKYTGTGTFTIVEEADGKGASKWGLLKSYQEKRNGWISLDYGKRV